MPKFIETVMWLSKHDCFKEIIIIPSQPIVNIIVLHSLIDNHAITNRYYIFNKELKAINSAPLWRKLNQKLLISICHKNQPKYSTVFTCVQRCSCSNLLRISRLILACLLSTIICQQTPSSLSFTPVALVISTAASS